MSGECAESPVEQCRAYQDRKINLELKEPLVRMTAVAVDPPSQLSQVAGDVRGLAIRLARPWWEGELVLPGLPKDWICLFSSIWSLLLNGRSRIAILTFL